MRQNLALKRKERDMTQEEVASFLNITTRHYRQLEAGTSEGSVPIWKKLALLYNTTIDCLLEQVDDQKKRQKKHMQRNEIIAATNT